MKVIHLPREQYEGYELSFDYESNGYYEVMPYNRIGGFQLVYQARNHAIPKTFIEPLYQPYWEHASAFAIEEEEQLVAFVEVDRELWSNRLRITNLLVLPEHRRKGYGKILMDHCKTLAIEEQQRAILLETQSCNTDAIAFYLSQEFKLIGLDTCCYGNHDIANNEVRLEFGYLLPKSI